MNDKDGTPIEIAAVVVWKVVNPAEAVFQVDDYEEFVQIQADAALRNLASRYSYDAPETDVHSLRGHIEEVAAQLKHELQERMRQAGVEVQESRISYLAYAPEIAAAMLQRQQAGAIIAARRQIVDGAVGMVEHALEMLAEKQTRRARPGAQGGDGEQPAGGAVRAHDPAAGAEHRHALQLSVSTGPRTPVPSGVRRDGGCSDGIPCPSLSTAVLARRSPLDVAHRPAARRRTGGTEDRHRHAARHHRPAAASRGRGRS